MSDRRQELYDLTVAFLEAFNRNDLDAVMAFFTDDIIYDGRAAVRDAFAPQFAGEHGAMNFVEDETFVDPVSGKVMSSWDLHITRDGATNVLRGLDLLYFEGDRIRLKQTYVKAKSPLYVAAA